MVNSAALLSTGDAYLLEFARGAVNRQLNGQPAERWGGWNFEDKVWGESHMAVRAELIGTIIGGGNAEF